MSHAVPCRSSRSSRASKADTPRHGAPPSSARSDFSKALASGGMARRGHAVAKFNAVLMIALVVMLPVVSANAMASLSITTFQGQDKARGVARGTDKLLIEAQVSVQNDSAVTTNQFRIISEGADRAATSCAPSSGGFKCTYNQDILGGRGTVPYRFELRDDYGKTIETTSETLKVDGVGADVLSIGLEGKVRRTAARISYVAEDTLSGSAGECSGIGKVELYVGGVTAKPIMTRPGSGSCREEAYFDAVAFSVSGEKEICIIAYDKIGQTAGPRCTSVLIDEGAPTFSNLQILDDNGNRLKHIPASGVTAAVAVTIEGGDVVRRTISANLAAATKSKTLTDVSPSSVEGDNILVARWNEVSIPSASGCQVTVTAEDDLGNFGNKTFGCGLAEDASPPALKVLTSTTVSANGTPVIGAEGTVIAQFDESGAGLANGNVFLDASSIGLGQVAPTNCSGGAGSWTCYWTLRPVTSGRVYLTINPSSSDDAGNLVDETTNRPVLFDVDTTVPVGLEVVGMTVLHGETPMGNFTVQGDTIEFKVKGRMWDYAYADFSALGGENMSACRERVGDICTFVTQVGISGPGLALTSFHFIDAGGNEASVRWPVFVFGTSDETTPNHWTSTVQCTPSLVDRSIAPLINTRVYCHVKLKPYSSDTSTVAIDLNPAECTGDTNYLADMGLSNNWAGSKEPILYNLLSATNYRVNQLSYTCTLKILSRVGDYITVNPELEKVPITIGFYSLPEEDLSAQVEKKFNDAKEDALKLDGLIGTLKKIFEVAEKFCSLRSALLSVLNAIDSTVGLITILKSNAEVSTVAMAGSMQAGCAAWCPTSMAAVTAGKVQIQTAAAEYQRVNSGLNLPTTDLPQSTSPEKVAKPGDVIGNKPAVPASAGPSAGTPKDAQTKIDAVDKAKKANEPLEATKDAAKQRFAAQQKLGNEAISTALKACEMTEGPARVTAQSAAAGIGAPAAFATQMAIFQSSCVMPITAYKNADAAKKKLEDARNKVCGRGEGLKKKFSESIDKYLGKFCNFVNCQSGPLNQEDGVFGKVLSAMGGGIWNPNKLINDATGGIGGDVSVKDSLVWSVATLCVPGIIANVDKYRQINCEYALCIGKDVVENGLPITQCEKKREALLCNFVWTQVFNSVPFVNTLESWVNSLKEMITNPVAALMFLLGKYCKGFCDANDDTMNSPTKYKICAFSKTADAIAQVVSEIKGIVNPDFWKIGEGACDELKDFTPTVKKTSSTIGSETGGQGIAAQAPYTPVHSTVGTEIGGAGVGVQT